jgi:hypothetical protein
METFYHFMHQSEPRKRGGSKARFKVSEVMKNFWKTHRENFSNKEHHSNYPSRITSNSKKGLRKWTRLLNKLNTTDESVNSKDYVMPIYRNGFIKFESFTPRNSNRLRYRMLIPREVYIIRQEEREKVFATRRELMYYITKLEKEHIEYVKAKYDKYFKTRSY